MNGVLLCLSLAAGPVLASSSSEVAPTSTVRRAPDDGRPARRSRDRGDAEPRVHMGAGSTAVAMLALVAAVVVRMVRRRRASVIVD